MVILEKDLQVLEQNYIPDVQSYVEADDVDELLDTIDNIIVDDILENNDEPSEVGRELQLIYDRIQRDNW